MRVAALYDIHGNLPALEAVLREVDDEGVDAILVGGDVLWGPFQSECLTELRVRGARFLSGNCEDDTLASADESFAWCREQLSDEELAFVATWPFSIELEIGKLGSVHFCHASPRSKTENLTRALPDADLVAVLDSAAARTVVCGHTHVQLDRLLPDGTRLVNAGSVGLPFEGRPGAFWAVLGEDVSLRRSEYGVEETLERVFKTGFPQALDVFGESLRGAVSAESATAHFRSRRGSLGS